MEITYWPTEVMLTDFFTKSLQVNLFRKFRAVILGHVPVVTLYQIDKKIFKGACWSVQGNLITNALFFTVKDFYSIWQIHIFRYYFQPLIYSCVLVTWSMKEFVLARVFMCLNRNKKRRTIVRSLLVLNLV